MIKIKQHIQNSIAVKQSILSSNNLLKSIEKAIETIAHSFKNDGKILLCGNGGSACDAMHLAEEFTGNYSRNRKPFPAIPLTDAGHITCTANDFGYENVFARAVEAYGKANDVLLAFSTSGNSENVVLACEKAKTLNMKIIAFTGETGGKLASICDVLINIPSKNTAHIQESHITIGHLIIEGVEDIIIF